MRRIVVAVALASLSVLAQARTYSVAFNGSDKNAGTEEAPFRTIMHAANLAQAGDTITVHEGIYRERIDPPRGGTSDTNRIVYTAAPGEKPVITGSEPVKGWVKAQENVWKVVIPNSFFGGFNPFGDLIRGDWFNGLGRAHHTGAVYLHGYWLAEAATLDDVMKPMGETGLWFAKVDAKTTTIWSQFKTIDPNEAPVEINVRQTVFYPRKTGINFITVRGFTLENAATNWAPPTAEQVGIVGPHWSKGWVIERNLVRNSVCSGISLGKYGDEFDNTSANSAEGYVKTIDRALAHGWTKENIGHHVVRNNTITDCGQAGIVGSMGAAFSTVTGNTIRDIHVRRTFTGAEMAGIKFHGAIDVVIAHNRIFRTCRALWLDWMAQGTRVSGNLFYENDEDVFVEVDHGPFVLENNLLLSGLSLVDNSQGGAYAHNLFAGSVKMLPADKRQTPFMKAHSTEVAGYQDNPRGDNKFLNNVFVQRADMSVYDGAPLGMKMDGNVYLAGAMASKFDERAVVKAVEPGVQVVSKPGGTFVEMKFDSGWVDGATRELVTSARLGKAAIPELGYEGADGAAVRVDMDYAGKMRSAMPTPGPFEKPGMGKVSVKVW